MEGNVGKVWERLNNILNDGQIDLQTYDVIDTAILLIEGIDQVVNLEYDIDMRYRVKEATEAINKVLGL